MKRDTFLPIIVAKNDSQVITNVGGRCYTMTPEAFFQVKDEKFFWDKRRKKTYPLRAKRDQRSLKSLVYGGRCYTISNDMTNLMPSNLMSTCHVEDISADTIRVHIGNGLSFLTDANQRDYVLSHKWSILELKKGYFYVCYQTKDKETGKSKLNLFHRHVVGATETAENTDHISFDTLDNRRSNLQILTLSENIHRINPLKKGLPRKRRSK